jgi:hypothetical protein
MTAPLCKCGCDRPIIQGQWGAEGDEAFAERLATGYARRKCARLHKPLPSPKVQTMELVSRRVGAREEMVTLEKEKRIDDPAYEAWVRTLPCLVFGCGNESQSHHQNERGKGGKSTKPSSYRCVPLCAEHHTLGGTPFFQGSYHGLGKITGWRFWDVYQIEPETVIHQLNRAWLEMGRKFKEG